jgi:hypothetical protein
MHSAPEAMSIPLRIRDAHAHNLLTAVKKTPVASPAQALPDRTRGLGWGAIVSRTVSNRPACDLVIAIQGHHLRFEHIEQRSLLLSRCSES